MTQIDFKNGDVVSFKAGPKSTGLTTATVTGTTTGTKGGYLVTKDDAGKERKVRPGACRKAA